MTRRYSHCNGNGRSGGGGGGVRLFGVRLTDGSFIKKSASMGCLSHQHSPTDSPADGYHSDDIDDDGFTARRRPLRKKGVPWTEPEHRQFLLGLEHLGRGNWRAISRNYVPTRTPTQVASHAQKYFLRLSNTNESGRRKRPSLFDLPTDMETDSVQPEQFSIPSAGFGGGNGEVMLSAIQEGVGGGNGQVMLSSFQEGVGGGNGGVMLSSFQEGVGGSNGGVMLSPFQEADKNNPPPSLDLSLKPAFTPFPFQLWPPNAYSDSDNEGEASQRQVLRPVQEEPIKELVGMSQLKLG